MDDTNPVTRTLVEHMEDAPAPRRRRQEPPLEVKGGVLDAKPKAFERGIKRAAFARPIFRKGAGARPIVTWLEGPVLITPVGIERDGILVPWGNIDCVEWSE